MLYWSMRWRWRSHLYVRSQTSLSRLHTVQVHVREVLQEMKKKVSIGMIILYGALSLLANLIASWVGLFIPRVIFSGLASASAAVINTVGVITVFPLTLVFAWGILYFIFFKGQFSNLYESSEDSNLWLKKTACFVFLSVSLQ